MLPFVHGVGGQAQIILRAGPHGGGEIQQRAEQAGAQAGFHGGAGRMGGEEIHVGKAGGAGADHFRRRQPGAVVHKALADKAPFGGPDMLFQPGHQGQVIGDTAQQVHGRVGMGIDQAGDQQVVTQMLLVLALPFFVGQGAGQQVGNASVLDHQGVIFQYRALRVDGGDPAGVDDQVGLIVAHA